MQARSAPYKPEIQNDGVTAKFDIYSRKTSIDSGLIEKCIFINVYEYTLLSSAPTNSARCNLCRTFFCFKSHPKNFTTALCSEEANTGGIAPLYFKMTDFFAARKIKKRKKLPREISEKKFYVLYIYNTYCIYYLLYIIPIVYIYNT